jgi:hypothetical protein
MKTVCQNVLEKLIWDCRVETNVVNPVHDISKNDSLVLGMRVSISRQSVKHHG